MNAATVPRPCPVCGADETVAYLQKNDLRLVRCRRCSMIYANPVRAEFVSGQYYDAAGPAYYLSPAKLESDYAGVRFDRELRLFRRHCTRGSVLDVGCSSGAFLFQLTTRYPGDYQVLGTDVSSAPLDYAQSRGVPVHRGEFLEQNFKEFDAVTFWAVLEHLNSPKSFLEKAWAVLKPGGFCFVLVPNMGSLAVRLLGARYRYFYPQHLNYFTKTTLSHLVESRFSIVATLSTHFNPIVIWQDWRHAGKEVSNAERADLLRQTTAYKQNPLLKPVKGLYQLVERGLGAGRLADNLALVLRKRAAG
jgi:2-polyprenyl-3-methyl-5-hydroxy-6-metoxy-1,4-benzoquinol methylase